MSCLKVMLYDASEQCGWNYGCHKESAAEGGDLAHFSLCFPLWGYIVGMKVKVSDPGRNSEWGRFRDKTNLRLAQGPPAVTNPGVRVRQTTGNRNGRGRSGPWGPGLRQPATEKREESGL